MSVNAGLPSSKLPALRLTTDGKCVLEDAVPLDLPSSTTGFSISVAPPVRPAPRISPLLSVQKHQQLLSPPQDALGPGIQSQTSSPQDSVQAGMGGIEAFDFSAGLSDPGLLSTRSEVPPPVVGKTDSIPPSFTRTATTPLPSQLNQLQHPYRTTGRSSPGVTLDYPESPHVKELSYELADSIQMIVQTLLQISPAQVLDPAKEQFTACSLSVPTSSMSAMFTVMKNINYLSANMSSYFGEPSTSGRRAEKQPIQDESAMVPPPLDRNEFDVGETLQAVGDSLSGCAAQAGVDLVLYHEDVSLKHVSVYGDEASLRYAITQVIQQVLNTAERGDSVELGLLLTPISGEGVPQQPYDPEISTPSNEGDDPILNAVVPDVALQCTIRISHKFAFPERAEGDPCGPEPKQTRSPPNLSTISIRQILRHTSSSLRSDLPPPPNFPTGRTIELEFPLQRARSSFLSPLSQISETGTQHDPNLPHLIAFAETLKGKRVTLYASAKGCFAQHLTSYLTAWGMFVSHVTPEGAVDGVTDLPPALPEPYGYSTLSGSAALLALAGKLDSRKMNGLIPDVDGRRPISFIFIDDDVEILKERLQALRQEYVPASYLHSMKRPPLASLHRPRSTNQVPFASTHTPLRAPPPVVILHFTSLSNYKHLKETVQAIITTFVGTSAPIPEVMIIPKPAGPRRFLAALYTAVTKPTVDPQFSPIATSPMSPGLSMASFFGPSSSAATGTPSLAESPQRPSAAPQPASPTKPARPTNSRTNSDRSSKSTREISEPPPPIPPSPLTIPDNIEYFSAAAQKLGSTPSSGVVIQSPDGQPTGILFQPNLKFRGSRMSPKILSTPSMERDDQGHKTPPLTPRRMSSARAVPSGMLDFRALHAASSSPSSVLPTGLPSVSGSTILSSIPLPSPGADRPVIVGGSSVVAAPKASPTLPTMIPATATTRKSSLGPKTQSPPGSPQMDGGTSRRPTTRKSSQPDKDSGGMLPSTQMAKKSKLGESNIIPPISVLIVDDNPINQTILSTFMRKKKIKYDIANNGAEAVQKWRTGYFHLILMDIQMPIMDGIEATKEIRRLEKTSAASGFPQLTPITEGQRTPSDTSESRSAASPYRSSVIIVALTASSLQSDRVAALAAGCNDFLTKPVSLLWLNNKIIEWGSIKALQMWADLRPDIVRSMNTGQAVQARAVADNLHMPRRKRTPSPRRSSSLKEEQDAAIALASPSGGGIHPAVQKAIESAEMSGNTFRTSSRLGLTSSSAIAARRLCTSPEAVAESRSPLFKDINCYPKEELDNGVSEAIASSQEEALPVGNDTSTTLNVTSTSQETIKPEKGAGAPVAPERDEAAETRNLGPHPQNDDELENRQ